MKEKIEELRSEFQGALVRVKEVVELEKIKNEFLGRKGKLASLLKDLINLPEVERKEMGTAANAAKGQMEQLFLEKQEEMARLSKALAQEKEWFDLSEPGQWPVEGHLHPVSQAIAEVTDIFARLGFARMRAPEIDWDWFVFEALNMPPDHPARDNWETFFVADSSEQSVTGTQGRLVLTPHTSNSQIHELSKKTLPVRMININRCYRRQSDISHAPMFHQFEGLYVDRNVTVAHLKGTLDYFARAYFGSERQIRLRPHHFRFTEPSFEVDISCDVCGGKENAGCRLCKSGWLELGGAGMVHPSVLTACDLDAKKLTGFAFGWGVERTLMMKEGMNIDDIRILYRGDLRFVEQF